MADVWEDLDTQQEVPQATQFEETAAAAPESWDEDEEEARKKKIAEEEAAKAAAEAKAKAEADAAKAASSAAKQRKKALKEREDADARKAAAEAAVAEAAADPVKAKQLRQRVVEETDFRNAQQMFGDVSSVGEMERFIPQSRDDYIRYATLLAERATHFSGNLHYVDLVKELVKLVTMPLRSDDLKQVSAVLTQVVNDRIREERGAPSTASKKKAQAQVQRAKARSIQQDEEEEAVEAGDVTAYHAPEEDYDFM